MMNDGGLVDAKWTRPGCSIEAIEVTLEDPLAHGRRGPARLAASIYVKGSGAFRPGASRRHVRHFRLRFNSSVWGWRWHTLICGVR